MCDVQTVSKIASILKVPAGNVNYNNEKVVTRATKTQTVSGFASILNTLSNESSEEIALNSKKSLETQCLVQNWIDFAVLYVVAGSKDKHVSQHLLNSLNVHLATRSYFVDEFLTIADLAIYYAVHDLVKTLSPIEKVNYLNLSRWFHHLQQNDKIRQGAPPINFNTIHLHGLAGAHI